MINSSLELASLEQKKAGENVCRLVEEQKVSYLYLVMMVSLIHCFVTVFCTGTT